MLVYRLIQAAYRQEPMSGQGAALYGGRWNPKGLSLLYTTESPALSLLEVLVHINPKHIPPYWLVTIEVPWSANGMIQENVWTCFVVIQLCLTRFYTKSASQNHLIIPKLIG